MTNYDPTALDRLGARRAALRTELKAVNDALAEEIPKALAAGILQADIVRRAGLARETVAQMARPPEQRWHRRMATQDQPSVG